MDPTRTLVTVWAALIIATAVSVAIHLGLGAGAAAIVAVLVLAFVKVWLVGRHFMELRDAPAILRRLFDGYVVVVPVVLAGILLLS
ncbi:cytochrome C oxidase subunit IV family protein [Actinomycetospora chibensis]|uniref:Cytochrome C oxidase subunit IV family protein n=1 Tax=Actinomycetospora chibensis TaxID=663606 RepID=A0ABV9REV6_9PSEU|nr:cytochrome C oxidase subunit IV family protein [Actinomycetospora chibensis]MDD7925062.1 cytochrome C oxidase subunit IV family protein [Actinomycetospora chibensis]